MTNDPHVEEDTSSVGSMLEPLNNGIEMLAIRSDRRTCPQNPPVKCLDHQCRGLDD